MSLRSTTFPSARQTYCCFRRERSSRCSMLKEMPELRAPENSFTGIEIKPKVRYPDQTEAAIVHPLFGSAGAAVHARASLRATPTPQARAREFKLHPTV